MRRFQIVVNGASYIVDVEELSAGAPAPVAVAPVAAAPVVAAPAAAAPAPAAPAAPAAPVAQGTAGSLTIKAPMPGTILNVSTEVGKAVKKGDVLMILEAMKMENEIQAPRDGVVASVNTSKGVHVNSGDLLLTMK